ncbi:MAG: hypothetical protein WBQ26_06125 [Gemmatimonadaceae bacterium]
MRRRRKKRVALPRVPQPQAQAPNERWAMDFVRDTLRGGRAVRAPTIIDTYTHDCAAIAVDVSLGSVRIVAVLEQLAGTRSFKAAPWVPGPARAASTCNSSGRATRLRMP